MHNFLRALRLAYCRPVSVALCIATSLAVAALWAVNLVAVWPIVDAVMRDMAIPQWVAQEAAEADAQVAALDAQRWGLARSAAMTSPADFPRLRQKLSALSEEAATVRAKRDRVLWIKPWVDRHLPKTPFDTLVAVCVFVTIGTLVKNALRVANSLLVGHLGCVLTLRLRDQFYQQVLRLDMAEFSERGRGDLMNRCTTDLMAVGNGAQVLIGQAVREPLKMFACLIGAAYFSWRLLILTVLVTPLAAYAIGWLGKALKRANRRAMEELSTIYETLTETLASMRAIKAYTTEPTERARFARSNRVFYKQQMKIALYNSLISPVTENLGVAMIVVAALAGGYLVLNQQTHLLGVRISDTPLTHGQMSVFFAMLAGMSDPARRLSGLLNDIQRAAASADRVYEVLDRQPRVLDPPRPVQLPAVLGDIAFNDVSFQYQPEKRVLDHVDLLVRRGETIAIVGPNGCGKSTLLNLLPRFYDVTSGSVTLGGIDLRDMRLTDLRSRIGMVSQDAILFNESVAANIAYGAPDATREQVEEAARKAHAHQFITTRLAQGYDTEVGPGGNRLSGGQRQRIALARAILRDPQVLILDEATSQIDVESERLIHEVLDEFTRGRTTLLITHRPSTLMLADRVVVMDRGRVDDIGTPDELLARCELFRSFCHVGYRQSA